MKKQYTDSKSPNSREALLKHFSPHVQKELQELFTHHEKMVEIFKRDESEKELFKNSPHDFFVKHNLKMPPYIQKRLKLFNYNDLKKEEKIVLPNGQVVSSINRVNIIFDQ